MSVKFELKSKEDRREAYNRIKELIHRDLLRKRIPTFHVLHVCYDGFDTVYDNHYMTPISLEPVDERGTKMLNVFDFDFFLRLLISLKSTTEVEYDPNRPAVIFTVETVWCD